jgi:segregation and condensation protein B
LAAEGFELNAQVRARLRAALEELVAEYAAEHRGMEIRQIAGGYRVATKPQYHDAVRLFAKSLKPPIRLSLQALETLSVIAYKQPVTVPEISEIRGVDSSGVIATLLERKLITTAGRKAVIGRPILYKTTREFLMRFGLKDVGELPSLEEFEKLAGEAEQPGLFPAGSVADATGVPDLPAEAAARPATESSSDETAGAAEASHAPTPVPEKVSHE